MTVTSFDLAALRANVLHNARERGYKAVYGPLVCLCAVPDCDGLGECKACRRKPLALLRRPS